MFIRWRQDDDDDDYDDDDLRTMRDTTASIWCYTVTRIDMVCCLWYGSIHPPMNRDPQPPRLLFKCRAEHLLCRLVVAIHKCIPYFRYIQYGAFVGNVFEEGIRFSMFFALEIQLNLGLIMLCGGVGENPSIPPFWLYLNALQYRVKHMKGVVLEGDYVVVKTNIDLLCRRSKSPRDANRQKQSFTQQRFVYAIRKGWTRENSRIREV